MEDHYLTAILISQLFWVRFFYVNFQEEKSVVQKIVKTTFMFIKIFVLSTHDFWIIIMSLFFLFFVVLGLEIRAFTLSHSTSPVFCGRIYQDRVLQSICLGWLQTAILLISASSVSRIIGVSHRHPAPWTTFKKLKAWWLTPVKQRSELQFQGSLGKKVQETHLNHKCWTWWYMTLIPTMREM
jgi:hypothetical protein